MARWWRDPSWRFAIGVYLVARVALFAWAWLVTVLMPVTLQNLDLFGAPTLAVFDLSSSERFAYSRTVEGTALFFRNGDRSQVVDVQTGSVWDLIAGRAISGQYTGLTLSPSVYSVEEFFPYRGVSPESNPLLALWQRFDTNWYLAIAAHGYTADGSTAYFPLYPALVHIVGNSMLAALVISNLALIGVLVLLYRLTAELFDVGAARRAVAYLILFPTGFFLLAGYAESLYLLFTLGAFLCARRGQWVGAAILGAVAALTRLQGVLLIVPLAYMWWKSRENDGAILPRYGLRFTSYASGLTLLFIPLATAAFLTFNQLSLFSSLQEQWQVHFVMPWESIGAAVAWIVEGHAGFIDGLNLFITFCFGVMLFGICKRMPIEYTLYAVAMLFVPLFRTTATQPLVSMARYALAIFPALIVWGVWGKNAWLNRAIIYFSLPLQLFLSAQFVMWGWVG